MPLSTLDQPVYAAKAELFKALGHPARIRILELLVDGEQPVSRLLAETGLEPSTLSQHLAIVKRIGLVESSRKGNAVTYRLTDPSVEQFLAAARAVLASTLGRARRALEGLERGLSRCDPRRKRFARAAAQLLPGRRDYVGISRSWRGDLLAGLTVGVVALPLALGFGVVSGVGARAGIVTAIVAGIVAAVFGGSSVQVSGPTGAMAVVLVPIVARDGSAAVATVAIIAGVLVVAMGLVGLGRLIQFVPWPVLEGFTVGIAIIIALQQLPLLLGQSKGSASSVLVSASTWPQRHARRLDHHVAARWPRRGGHGPLPAADHEDPALHRRRGAGDAGGHRARRPGADHRRAAPRAAQPAGPHAQPQRGQPPPRSGAGRGHPGGHREPPLGQGG